MSNDIEFLIKNLETERRSLKRFIRDAVKEGEYLIAHYHAERMAQVYQQLQTFRNLDDRLHDRKKMIARMIRLSEARLKSDQAGGLRKYLEGQVLKDKEELEQLDLRGKVPVDQSDLLDVYLRLLLDKRVKRVKLVLHKEKRFMMVFRRCKGGLGVSIPNLKALQYTYMMDDDKLAKFLILGFKRANDASKLDLLIRTNDGSDGLARLKVIISIIVFEMFYFAEFQGESLIEVEV